MATPAQLAQDERVADVLMAMEGQLFDAVRCAPVVVISPDAAPRPVLGLHVAGRHFRLGLDEARCVAVAVRVEDASPHAKALAAAIELAAAMTELLWLRARCQRMQLELREGGQA